MQLGNRRKKQALFWIAGGLGLFLLGNLASSLYFGHSFLRPRRKKNKTSDLEGFVPETKYRTSSVEFRSTDDMRISALLLEPEDPNGHAVIVCHGLAHDKQSGIRFVQYLLREKYTLLLIDFRNHGESDGSYTTYGYYERHDLLAAVRYLKNTVRIDGRIGILGASMGASVALLAAAETDEVHGLVLDSPFGSLRQITMEWAEQFTRFPRLLLYLPVRLAYLWLLIFVGCRVPDVEPREKVRELRCPVFLIHGGADSKIPASHSHAIFANATVEKELWILEEAGHLGVYLTDPKEYERRVLEFFRRTLIEPVAASA